MSTSIKMQEIDIGNCFYDQVKLNQYVREPNEFSLEITP